MMMKTITATITTFGFYLTGFFLELLKAGLALEINYNMGKMHFLSPNSVKVQVTE